MKIHIIDCLELLIWSWNWEWFIQHAKLESHLPWEILELHLVTEHLQELVESGTWIPVAKHLLLCGLAVTLVHDAELELVDEGVLIVTDNQFGTLWKKIDGMCYSIVIDFISL